MIDCEWGWRFTHENLCGNRGGVIAGAPAKGQGYQSHGTAVIGAISGDIENSGICGIAPDTDISASSVHDQPISKGIQIAADKLWLGDILVLENSKVWGQRGGFLPNGGMAFSL